MTFEFELFAFTLFLEFLLGGGLVVSLLFPKYRVWPPPKKGSWQFWYTHFLTESSIFFFLVLGFLDWNTFFPVHWLRLVFASILMVVGAIVFLWALRNLTLTTSLGLKGKLVTKGPYRYSRNPQYIATVLLFSGAIIFFNSSYAFITGIIGNILFLITPFIEEPWLRERFKKEYVEYCREVPRFI